MTQSPAEQTGANVRAELARRKLSQAQLAAHLGISQVAVSARLRGQVAFDVDELSSVADFLDLDPASLLPSREPVAS